MDPSAHPLHNVTTPDNPDDEKIKPMILAFKEKIKLNPLAINEQPAGHKSLQSCAIRSNVREKVDEEAVDHKGVVSGSAYHPAEAEEELWPKITELDDRPSSPTSQSDIAIKQVISESTYLSPKDAGQEHDDPPPSQSKPTEQMISKPAYQKASAQHSSDDDLQKPGIEKPKLHVIREDAYQKPSKAMLDGLSFSSSSPTQHNIVKPRVQIVRDPAYEISPMQESPQVTIRENFRSSAQARLSCVLEESESFSKREFGDHALNYMSTFNSASHASNVASPRTSDFSFDYAKHVSYRHNNYHQFTYNLSINHEPGASGSIMSSKSAPAGTATRTGSAFGLFRRGTSERSGLKMGRRTVYRPRRPRKPRTLTSTLLWPLLKIRNGYVGCMMGLEGTGDLSGMAQGGSYATAGRYFADVPLSKSDSRNYG